MKYNFSEMKSLDFYISSLSYNQYKTFSRETMYTNIKTSPLLSWDLFMSNYKERLILAKKNTELKQVLSFSEKFKWKNDLNKTIVENDYMAIIITDIHQNIIWVNKGFTTMTGYTKKYALNKTPRFLQGKETASVVKNRFKNKITANKPFKEIIINHRKDKSTYKCEVKVFPLFKDKTTHFIALEKEIGN